MIDHPHDLAAFVAGKLSEAEANRVISHLSDCEACLDQVDALWAIHADDLEPIVIPELDPDTIARLEGQLLRRIQRSDLSGRAVWLGTSGMLDTYLTLLPPTVNTWLALLRPLLTLGQPSKFSRGLKND